MTTVQTFIEALRRRQTNTTLGFDAIFTPPYNTQDWLEEIMVEHAFDDALPPKAAKALGRAGLKPAEIAHLNLWPEDQKEAARLAVVQAIQASPQLRVRFFWDLTDGPEPKIEIVTSGDPYEVTFFTPRSALRQAGPDDIDVGIYPPPFVPEP
jgi:hypothetical protein